MTRKALIKRTVDHLEKLPDQKVREVSDFAEFLVSRIDNQMTTQGIQELATKATAFKFLEAEEDLYPVNDLKERYK